MKKLLLIGVSGLAFALTAQAAFQGTVTIASTRPAGGGSGIYGGGAFTADVISGLSSVIGGNGLTGAAGSGFSTFCIEFNEHISLPGTYYANIGFAAINGSGGPLHPDPVSKATAWLYSQFRSGTLAAATGGVYQNNNAENDALQQAIWWLEQETSAFGVGAPGGSEVSFNNYLVAAAVTATGAADALTARTIAANGAYGVVALNLYDRNTGDAMQSQLAIVPETSTIVAGALLLLPLGASAVRILRKNRVA